MNRRIAVFALGLITVLVSLFLTTAVVSAQDFPNYQGFVNDFAGLLSADGKSLLEASLSQLEKDTTAQVAIVTMKSLDGDSIEDYSYKLFEKWGIGKKDQNNGVLFLVALDERKMRIEVGYGLEPIITDGRAGRIRDENVIPKFKTGDYEGGIIDGTAAIEKYIREGTTPAPLEENPVKSLFGDFTIVFFILTFITIYLSGFMARSKSVWLGGIWGAIAGAVLGLAIGGIVALIISTIFFTGLGFGTDALLSRNYQARKASGKSTDWRGSGGGFWGGGFGGGGGSSSGGFGGFGGGMSGGGGASGSW
jgi:uncharacterized protein